MKDALDRGGASPLPGPHPAEGRKALGNPETPVGDAGWGDAPRSRAAPGSGVPRRVVLGAPLLLLARRAHALDLPAAGLAQGGFVQGHAAPGTRLALDGRVVRVAADGAFAFGFGRDHGAASTLAVTHPDGRREERRLPVARRQWSEQRISGLPPAQVTPDAETLERILRERERLAAARATDSALTGFAEGFRAPASGRISGVFGSRRILNGQPRQPHYGLDFAVPTGTPLLAAAAGRVTLAAAFHFFGDLVVIDHGHGVNTLYAHLSRIDVSEGQMVGMGERIALSGATGRVTGPHLHFSLSWYQVWLDPQPVVL